MADPIFSPDGKWMWTGNEWIPAPPSTHSQTANISSSETEPDRLQVINSDTDVEQSNHLVRETQVAEENAEFPEIEVPSIRMFSTKMSQSTYLIYWSIGIVLIALALRWTDGIFWNTALLILGGYAIIECLIVTTKFRKKNKLSQYSLPWKVHILTTASLWLVVYLVEDAIPRKDVPGTEFGAPFESPIAGIFWLVGLLSVLVYTVILSIRFLKQNPAIIEQIKADIATTVGIVGGAVQLSQGQMPEFNSNNQTKRVSQPCHSCNNKMKIMYRFSKCGRVLCSSCSQGFSCKNCAVGCIATQIT